MAVFGLIGLGKMGMGFCANLLRAGHALVVWDINRDAVERALELGAREAVSVAELSKNSDATLSCLPRPCDVEKVLFGEEGIMTLRGHAPHFDMSTIDIEHAVLFEKKALALGHHYLSALVHLGPAAAEAGKSLFTVGGHRESYNKFRESLFAKMGESVWLGGVETAIGFKLLTNLLGLSTSVLVGESITLAKKLGIKKEDFLSLIPRTGADSYQFRNLGGSIWDEDFSPSHFTASLAKKDLTQGLALAASLGNYPPMMEKALSIFEETVRYYGDDDFTSTCKLIPASDDKNNPG